MRCRFWVSWSVKEVLYWAILWRCWKKRFAEWDCPVRPPVRPVWGRQDPDWLLGFWLLGLVDGALVVWSVCPKPVEAIVRAVQVSPVLLKFGPAQLSGDTIPLGAVNPLGVLPPNIPGNPLGCVRFCKP